MVTIRSGSDKDIPQVIAIWERSVRATHDFLGERDIVEIREQITGGGLAGLYVRIALVDGEPVGFMALDGDMIEALFIDPPHRGKGIGCALAAPRQGVAWQGDRPSAGCERAESRRADLLSRARLYPHRAVGTGPDRTAVSPCPPRRQKRRTALMPDTRKTTMRRILFWAVIVAALVSAWLVCGRNSSGCD